MLETLKVVLSWLSSTDAFHLPSGEVDGISMTVISRVGIGVGLEVGVSVMAGTTVGVWVGVGIEVAVGTTVAVNVDVDVLTKDAVGVAGSSVLMMQALSMQHPTMQIKAKQFFLADFISSHDSEC